jgi:hypothetical protein
MVEAAGSDGCGSLASRDCREPDFDLSREGALCFTIHASCWA